MYRHDAYVEGSSETDKQSAKNLAKQEGRHGRESGGKGYWVSCPPPPPPSQKGRKGYQWGAPKPPQRIPVYRKCKPSLSGDLFSWGKRHGRMLSPIFLSLSQTHTDTHTPSQQACPLTHVHLIHFTPPYLQLSLDLLSVMSDRTELQTHSLPLTHTHSHSTDGGANTWQRVKWVTVRFIAHYGHRTIKTLFSCSLDANG